MTRHPIRWESLASGLFFVAVVGNWAAWEQDLLTAKQLSLTASGVLILLGLVGVLATVWRSRPASAPPLTYEEPAPGLTETTTHADPHPEGPEDEEEAHPKP